LCLSRHRRPLAKSPEQKERPHQRGSHGQSKYNSSDKASTAFISGISHWPLILIGRYVSADTSVRHDASPNVRATHPLSRARHFSIPGDSRLSPCFVEGFIEAIYANEVTPTPGVKGATVAGRVYQQKHLSIRGESGMRCRQVYAARKDTDAGVSIKPPHNALGIGPTLSTLDG
jgi:hypothetical protein